MVLLIGAGGYPRLPSRVILMISFSSSCFLYPRLPFGMNLIHVNIFFRQSCLFVPPENSYFDFAAGGLPSFKCEVHKNALKRMEVLYCRYRNKSYVSPNLNGSDYMGALIEVFD